MATTDATPIPVKNQAYRVSFPILDADGDLVTGAGSLDSELSADGGTFADATNEATEIATASGMYYLEITAGEMNYDTVAVVVISASGKTTPIVLYPQETGDIKVDVQSISGDSGAADNCEAVFDNTGYDMSASEIGTVAAVTAVSTGGITAGSIATDAIGAAELAADAVAEIVDAVWNEAMSGHVTVGTYGQAMRGLGLTGEVADAAATTTDFDVDGFTEATDNHFNGSVMVFTSGALAGQARVITDYTGTGQNCVFGEAWTDAPADNDDFVIMPMGTFLGGTLSEVARLFVTILNASTGQLDAGSLTAGTIDAGALAADAIDEIWDEAMTESAGVPAVTASFRDALKWMFALTRNKLTQTTTTQTLRNDADSGDIATAAVSDNGTTATRAEWA